LIPDFVLPLVCLLKYMVCHSISGMNEAVTTPCFEALTFGATANIHFRQEKLFLLENSCN